MTGGRVAACVLAAGRSERFGAGPPKVLRRVHGRPLVAHALDAALGSGLAPVLLVVGEAGGAVAAVAPAGVEIVENPDRARGIGTSLAAGVRALAPRAGIGAVVVGLADQPRVGPGAYRRLAAAYHDGARLAVATYGGVRGNPVLVGRDLWDAAGRLTGDEGGRVLMAAEEPREVACDGTGDPTDVDTPEDLARLEAAWRSPTPSA